MAALITLLVLGLASAPALGHDPPAEEKIRVENARVNFEAGTSISASPSTGLRSGDWVTVKYSAGGSPKEDDWIAAYAPAPAELNASTPVKFQWATVDPGYLSTGSGEMRLRLINVRAPYTFVLMRGGMESPSASAMSGLVEFADYNEISQVHTMVTPRSGELRVQWVMRDALAGCTVRYGPSNSSMPHVASASSTTYGAGDLCGGVATSKGWRDPGSHYHAILTGLEPGGRVWYHISCPGGHALASPINASVPVGANASASVTVAVFGDMGTAQADGSEDLYKHGQPGTLNTSATLESLMDRLDAVMHIGDISCTWLRRLCDGPLLYYGRCSPVPPSSLSFLSVDARGYEVHWNEFGEQVQAVASRVPWQQGIGNHERDFPNSGSLFQGWDSGGECGVPYATRFTNPRTESAADEPWYSWDIGPIHFTIMSTEHNFTRGSAQWAWLEQDLAQVDRKATPWVVFGGHRCVQAPPLSRRIAASLGIPCNDAFRFLTRRPHLYPTPFGLPQAHVH